MRQESLVLTRDLTFTDYGNFVAKAGDVFVYTPPTHVVVYRGGNIVIQMGTTPAAINGFMISKILVREPATPVVAESTPVVETPQVPDAETAPVSQPAAPEAPEETPEEAPDGAPTANVTEASAVEAPEATPEVPEVPEVPEAPVASEVEAPKAETPKKAGRNKK